MKIAIKLTLCFFFIGQLITSAVANELSSNTVLLSEIKYWASDDPEVKRKSSIMHDRLIEKFPRGGFYFNEAKILSACNEMNIQDRKLEGDELLKFAQSINYMDDPNGLSYLLGLAYVAERKGRYIKPTQGHKEDSLIYKFLSLYGKTTSQYVDNVFAVGILSSDLLDSDIQTFATFYIVLPKSCDKYSSMFFTSIKNHSDGALSTNLAQYVIANYLMEDIVEEFIVRNN